MDVRTEIQAELNRVERVLDEGEVEEAVRELIQRKKAGEELDRGPQVPALSGFLSRELDRLSQLQAPATPRVSSAELDQVFRECLIDLYGATIQAKEPPGTQPHRQE